MKHTSYSYSIVDLINHTEVARGIPTRQLARETKRVLDRHSNEVRHYIIQNALIKRYVR